jgi:hydrophobe/amphiphile efflux-1 (HAE1) family protein
MMALNISAWSIRQPLPSIVMMATLVLVGFYAFTKMPITRNPNIDAPVVSVVITQFGASPAELESQVTKKVEDTVASIEGVHHIDSTILDGITTTTIQFRLEVDTTRALNDVKDAITRIRADLPQTINEPYVQRFEIAPLPIMTYAAIAPGKTPEQLSWFVEDVVVRALQGIPGVGRVERIGRVEREIRVGLDPMRLVGVGLTAREVSMQLRGSNVDVAGGRAEIGGRGEAIRTLAGAKTVAELRATRITLPTGGDLRLDDLGSVTDGIAEQSTFARYNNTAVVGFSIMRSKGASDVVVGDAVKARVEKIQKEHPDVTLKLIDNSVTYTFGDYEAALHTLYEGAVLAIVVVFLFLRDWRATIIAALTLPLSILPSFWVMNALGFSLNIVSLLAIVLTTGILVDDAIVEIENIVRHMHMGKSPYQAALEAADEIGLAVIAISLTIVAVFLPASFMQSIPGQFFKQFGLTVAVQVLFSLFCARLITPMLAAYFLKPHKHAEETEGPIMRRYGQLVTWAVRHRFTTIIIGLLIFGVSMAAANVMPTDFLPPSDTARSTMCIELPPGSQLSDTQEVADIITKRLLSRPEVESVFVDGGRVPPDRTEVRVATLTINYVEKGKRSISQKKLEEAISKDLAGVPDFRSWYLDENAQRSVSFWVTGDDMNTVGNVASDLASQMRKLPMIMNIVPSTALERPELRIRPRRDLAVRLGISTESLSETIRVATIGDIAQALAQYHDEAGDRIVPIRVLLEEQARADQQVLEQLRVPSPAGIRVPLKALADIGFGAGPSKLDRHERQKQASVEADLVAGAALSEALDAVKALPMLKNLPPGINVSEGGNAELQDELFSGFNKAMQQGLTMVYVVLALLFGSLLQPMTVMFSLPLSVAGAILVLYLASLPITTPVVIGILMLMGIVSKNAIMLVDFAVESIHKGMARNAAIIDAGQKRARPIIMTSIAMAAGMAPSALGIGAGGEFRSPMAIAVIGGILVSTLLSLLFVPAFFTVIDDLGALCARWFSRVIGPAEEAEPAHAPPSAVKPPEPVAKKAEKGEEMREPDVVHPA